MSTFSLKNSTLLLATLIITTKAIPSFAAEVEINGGFDFYYQASPNAIFSESGPRTLAGRYFDRYVNHMTLNMAEVSFKHKSEKTLLYLSLAAGETVDELSGGKTASQDATRNVTQAYLQHTVNNRLSVSLGKFYSFLGLEVTKASDNWQYSRSLTYNYALPFWHQGFNVSYAWIPNKLTSTFYVLNAWDGRTLTEQNESLTLGLNINASVHDDLIVNYNVMTGNESVDSNPRQTHEINFTYKMTPQFTFAGDFVYGDQKIPGNDYHTNWLGLAVYMKSYVTEKYNLSSRLEFFDDSKDGFAFAGGLGTAGLKQQITSFTLTNSYRLSSNLETRFEFRSDKSNVSEGLNQDSYALAALYTF